MEEVGNAPSTDAIEEHNVKGSAIVMAESSTAALRGATEKTAVQVTV
jgi:hypothetical protein